MSRGGWRGGERETGKGKEKRGLEGDWKEGVWRGGRRGMRQLGLCVLYVIVPQSISSGKGYSYHYGVLLRGQSCHSSLRGEGEHTTCTFCHTHVDK